MDKNSTIRAKGLDRHNDRTPHIEFEQTTKGWPGSRFDRQITNVRARRVDHGNNDGEEIQIEICIYTYYGSGNVAQKSTSFSLPQPHADAFISHLMKKGAA